jgi:predicted flap endonuclease-1-like 5' DNA nuclease
MQTAARRLWLTENKDRVVLEGDPAAAFLLAAAGCPIGEPHPDLPEGWDTRETEPETEPVEGKAEDDAPPTGGAKTDQQPPAGDNTPKPKTLGDVRGIGQATEAKLAAMGVTTLALLLERDPGELATITGAKPEAVADWLSQAAELTK